MDVIPIPMKYIKTFNICREYKLKTKYKNIFQFVTFKKNQLIIDSQLMSHLELHCYTKAN